MDHLSASEAETWRRHQARRVNPYTAVDVRQCAVRSAVCATSGVMAGGGLTCLVGLAVGSECAMSVGAAVASGGYVGYQTLAALGACILPAYFDETEATLARPAAALFGSRVGGSKFATIYDLLPLIREELQYFSLPATVPGPWVHIPTSMTDITDEDFKELSEASVGAWQKEVWSCVGERMMAALAATGCVVECPGGTFTVENIARLSASLSAFGEAYNLSDAVMGKVHDSLVLLYAEHQSEELQHKRSELQRMYQSIIGQMDDTPDAALLAGERHADIDDTADLVAHAIGEIDGGQQLATAMSSHRYIENGSRTSALKLMRENGQTWLEAESERRRWRQQTVARMRGAGRSTAHLERFLRQSPHYTELMRAAEAARNIFVDSKSRVRDEFTVPGQRRLEALQLPQPAAGALCVEGR